MTSHQAHTRPKPLPWTDSEWGVAVSSYRGLHDTPHKELIHVAVGGVVERISDDEPLTLTACGRSIDGTLLPDFRLAHVEWSICRTCVKRQDPRWVLSSTDPSDQGYENAPLLGTWVSTLWLDMWFEL